MSERLVALVVDDDAAMRLMVGNALEEDGFDVVEAGDGEQAMECFLARPPDLVVMDVLMPRRDGYSACAAMRARPEGALIPVLMMTGLEDTESIERAYAAGATDFVTKPVNYSLLRHRVRYLMRASDAIGRLADSERRLSRAQRVARLGYWEGGADVLGWSENVRRILGLEPGVELEGLEAFLAWVPQDERQAVRDWFETALRGRGATSITHRVVRADGAERFVRQQVEPAADEGGVHGTLQDITELHQAERRIHRLAYFDGLTGLPNREYFRNRIHLITRLARRRGSRFAVLLLDLNDFKRINDSLGHEVGDRVLRITAERLVQGLRATDLIDAEGTGSAVENLARIGGDEFALVLPNLRSADEAGRVARRIVELFGESMALAEHEVHTTPSIGIAVFPTDGQDADGLLKNADMAMYYAKRSGHLSYEYFDASMNEAALRRLTLETEMRRGLERGEFHLQYQPQMDVADGAICGVEALLRWRSPTLGIVTPVEFIPLAEETGLIFALGEWVLWSACRQLDAWHEEGVGVSRVAVNVSALQFARPGFVELVGHVLEETGLDPRALELEVTEGLLMRDADDAVTTLGALKRLGVQIAIDDFGTGYSSLSYLERFPIDRLKIDKAFVSSIKHAGDDSAIASAVIAMAASMGLRVVAEGVETEDQLRALRAKCCNEIQGYFLSRPLDPEAVPGFLSSLGDPEGSAAGAPIRARAALADTTGPCPGQPPGLSEEPAAPPIPAPAPHQDS